MKAVVAILTLDEKDFKTKTVIKAKEGHYKMVKESIQQEDITFINIYASNIRVPKNIKQILPDLKGETDSDTMIVWKFNTPLTSMDKLSRLKIN